MNRHYHTPEATVVNGRTYYFTHLRDFTRVGTCTYRVRRNETVYEIFGGKLAGGRSNEWYVTTDGWATPIHTTSLVDSLRLLENM